MNHRYNDALSRALNDIPWTPLDLAQLLVVRPDTVRKWLSGRSPTPPQIQTWIEDIAEYHRAHPPPELPPERRP